MDITITLTDEQVTALETLIKSGQSRFILRRLGIRDNPVDMRASVVAERNASPKTTEQLITEYANTVFKGVATEAGRTRIRPIIQENPAIKNLFNLNKKV